MRRKRVILVRRLEGGWNNWFWKVDCVRDCGRWRKKDEWSYSEGLDEAFAKRRGKMVVVQKEQAMLTPLPRA